MDPTIGTKEKLGLDEVERVEASPETYATIMATNKPDVRGPGYMKLYMLAGIIFLCSTMTGTATPYSCRDY